MVDLQDQLSAVRDRLAKALRLRDLWKARALKAEARLPGSHTWKPEVERWRGLCHYYLAKYGGDRYLSDPGPTLDLWLGIMQHESGGDPLAVSSREWIAEPPPGYDGTPATRASCLFQIPPAFWPDRSRAAGFRGRSIFDVDAHVGTAAWLLWDGWHPETAPHWTHWSAAHVGLEGSYEWALRQLGGGR